MCIMWLINGFFCRDFTCGGLRSNVPMLYEGGEIDAHPFSLTLMINSSTTVQIWHAAPLLYSVCWQQLILIKMKKPTEVNLFYEECENKYNALIEEILQRDCQRVEFIRGMISIYKEILSSKKHWEDKEATGFSYFK
jgi:hypothetical protein